MAYKTHVGSLDSYKKGLIELDDDLRKYAFSNVYEVAGKSAPFERVAVVQNLQYVAEVVRIEGESPWYAAPHDEFAIVMDGEVTFNFVKLADDQVPGHEGGAAQLGAEPNGPPAPWARLRRRRGARHGKGGGRPLSPADGKHRHRPLPAGIRAGDL